MAKKKVFALPVKHEYLNKKVCIEKAKDLAPRININKHWCAEEIFAHAVMFYGAEKLNKKFHLGLHWILRHADPIDLEEGGDSKHRIIVYRLIWRLVPSK